jgi:hypothetical protein
MGGLFWVCILVASLPAAALASLDCHVPAKELQPGAALIAQKLASAFAKNSRGQVRALLTDPLVVRLGGKKRLMPWKEIDARFDEVFGPRVREAITAGTLRRSGYTWVLGDKAVFIGFHQHGKECRLEIDRVFEDRPSENAE